MFQPIGAILSELCLGSCANKLAGLQHWLNGLEHLHVTILARCIQETRNNIGNISNQTTPRDPGQIHAACRVNSIHLEATVVVGNFYQW